MFSEISQNSQENTCARVSFLIKLQACCNFIKKETGTGISCEFCKIPKNTFSYRPSPVAASILWSPEKWSFVIILLIFSFRIIFMEFDFVDLSKILRFKLYFPLHKIKHFVYSICWNWMIYYLRPGTFEAFWNKMFVPLRTNRTCTAKNTGISPNFLVWKFCGKAQFPHMRKNNIFDKDLVTHFLIETKL